MKIKKLFIILLLAILTLYTGNISFAADEPNIYSEAAIIIEASSGRVLYEKNSTEQKYPASTTKMITAILTIENCELDEIVTVNYNAISTIPSGYSTAELVADEELTIKQLLEVLLVHSANDAANVLAMYVGGSIESFVSMMNSKATEIGCTNTNFTNAYGKQDENHYSTAEDLAKIAQYCMKNTTFRSFVSQSSCTITATNKHEARTYNNTNDLIRTSSDYYYEYAIGIKTGYTKEAKNCLVAASNKDGFETITVVLGADTTPDGLSARYVDTTAMFDYAYQNYSIQEIASKNDVITQTKISNGTKDTKNLDVLLSDDITVLANASEDLSTISPTIMLDGNLSAPLAAGTVIGTVEYTVDGITYQADLIAAHNVEKSDLIIVIFRIILALIILFTLFKLIFKRKNKRNKNIYRHYLYR